MSKMSLISYCLKRNLIQTKGIQRAFSLGSRGLIHRSSCKGRTTSLFSTCDFNRRNSYRNVGLLLSTCDYRTSTRTKLVGLIKRSCSTNCDLRANDDHRKSVLYVNTLDDSNTAIVDIDLNVEERLKHLDKMKNNLTSRKSDFDLKKCLNSYHEYMSITSEKDLLEAERDKVGSAIGKVVKDKTVEGQQKKKEYIKQGQVIKEKLKKINRSFHNLEKDFIIQMLHLPNDLHESTTDAPVLLDQFGTPNDNSRSKSHVQIGKESKTLRLYEVSSGAFYLTGSLAQLELELYAKLCHAMDDLGISQFTGPDTVRSVVMEACGKQFDNRQKVFTIQDKPHSEKSDDDKFNRALHLCGVSPMVFMAYFTKLNVLEKSLPIKFYSLGTSYTPDTIGNTSKFGLLGAPQTKKLELFGAAASFEEAENIYQDFIEVTTTLYIQFDLPFRVVQVSASDLKTIEMCRIDFEVWMPSLKEYFKVGEVALWGDFASRRLMAKFSNNINIVHPQNFIFTVHATAMNVHAMIAAMVENKQTVDLGVSGNHLENKSP